MYLALIFAATLAMQTPEPSVPILLPPAASEFGTSGHWTVIRQSTSCLAMVAYAPRADGGRRALSIAWIVNNPARRLLLSINDTGWREPFETNRNDYRLEYVGDGQTAAANPPPVVSARITSQVTGSSGTLAILFDDAAARAAIENLSRSIGFEIYRGRRRISTDRLDGAAGALQLLT